MCCDLRIASGTSRFGIPAAKQQHAYSPIVKHPPRGLQIEWTRIGIVFAILVVAILANVTANVKFPALLDTLPVIGLAVWTVILVTAPLRRPDWEVMEYSCEENNKDFTEGHIK